MDNPLEPLNYKGTPVVDLAGYRLECGKPKYGVRLCQHKKLMYSESDKFIWCQDCNAEVSGIDAFFSLAKDFSRMILQVQGRERDAKEAINANIHRVVAKELARTWAGKMVPACPHCKAGLLPEDFKGGGVSYSRELEIARRKKKAEES